MNAGILEGGWAFVWAAYGVTAVTLIAYTLSIAVRTRFASQNPEEIDE